MTGDHHVRSSARSRPRRAQRDEARHDVEDALPAQKGMSSSSSGAFSSRLRPLFDARSASSAPLHVPASRAAASAASVRSRPRSDGPGDEHVVERKGPLHARADDDRVPLRRLASHRRSRPGSGASRRAPARVVRPPRRSRECRSWSTGSAAPRGAPGFRGRVAEIEAGGCERRSARRRGRRPEASRSARASWNLRLAKTRS